MQTISSARNQCSAVYTARGYGYSAITLILTLHQVGASVRMVSRGGATYADCFGRQYAMRWCAVAQEYRSEKDGRLSRERAWIRRLGSEKPEQCRISTEQGASLGSSSPRGTALVRGPRATASIG